MKKTRLLATTAALFLTLGFSVGYAHMGPGMTGPGNGYGPSLGQNYNYCPYCGNYIGPGYGMGPEYGLDALRLLSLKIL